MYPFLNFALHKPRKESQQEPELHPFVFPKPDPEPHQNDTAPKPFFKSSCCLTTYLGI
jgi:hypothetical protein